jgi:hypothetical protein
MGLAESDILDNQFGNVVWFGQIKNFNTGSLTLGQVLYFDTSSGSLTATEPATNKIIVAAVEKVSSGGGSNGILLVRIKWVSRDIDEVDGLTDALAGKSDVGHTHPISDVVNLQTSLNAKLNLTGGTLTGKLTVSADADNEQVLIRRFSNNNEQLILGFHSGDYAQIQAVEQSVGYRPLSLNPNGGNLGIGTTTPSFKLDVSSGDIRVQNGGNVASAGGSINFSAVVNALPMAQVKGLLGFSGSPSGVLQNQGDLGIFTRPVTGNNEALIERLRVRSDGNVGINETSPTAQLQVKSSATNKVPLVVDTLTSGHTANIVDFRANNATRSFIDLNGNFGTSFVYDANNINNGYVQFQSTGIRIVRNIADANDALTVNLANASSTGLILDAQAAGTTVASIAKNGTVTAPSVVATSTVKIGSWVLSENGTSGSLDFVIG